MKQRWKSIALAACLIIGCAGITLQADAKAVYRQQEIAGQVLRLHVRANSNSERDQEMKLMVKDRIISALLPYRQEMTDINTSKEIIKEHTALLKDAAYEVLAQYNSDYKIDINIGNEYFPVKEYGDVTLPEGNYEAVIVEIGQAQGKNWWCVLFPQLCFIDPAYGYVPEASKAELKAQLSEETYDTMLDKEVQARFKLGEFFSGLLGSD